MRAKKKFQGKIDALDPFFKKKNHIFLGEALKGFFESSGITYTLDSPQQ